MNVFIVLPRPAAVPHYSELTALSLRLPLAGAFSFTAEMTVKPPKNRPSPWKLDLNLCITQMRLSLTPLSESSGKALRPWSCWSPLSPCRSRTVWRVCSIQCTGSSPWCEGTCTCLPRLYRQPVCESTIRPKSLTRFEIISYRNKEV